MKKIILSTIVAVALLLIPTNSANASIITGSVTGSAHWTPGDMDHPISQENVLLDIPIPTIPIFNMNGSYGGYTSGNLWLIASPQLGSASLMRSISFGGGPNEQTSPFFTTPLSLGDIVDAKQSFIEGNGASISGADQAYFGFVINDPTASTLQYGWIDLDGFGSKIGTETVTATWAYDTTGAGIEVGTIPEPSTYALFGLGALALVLVNRRRKVA
jgi:hypothetical protein